MSVRIVNHFGNWTVYGMTFLLCHGWIKSRTISWSVYMYFLEDTTRYAGLLLALEEGFGLWKKRAYYAVLAQFVQY